MKMNLYYTFFLAFLFTTVTIAQVGIGTSSPNASSMLEIQSTQSGILIPRMSQAQRLLIASPARGLLVYQTDSSAGFWYFDGSIWIELKTKRGEFISESGAIHNTTSYDDDFVVGSAILNDNPSSSSDDSRIFFDKGKSAFRVGYTNNTNWDNSNLGSFSSALGREHLVTAMHASAMGRNHTVSGESATALGNRNTASGEASLAVNRSNTASAPYTIAGGIASQATGSSSFAFGNTSRATAENSIAMGRLNNATALGAIAMGFTNTASGLQSIAMGEVNTSSGVSSITLGNNLVAPSFSEVVVGTLNERYSSGNATTFTGNDRIFSVGNGFTLSGVTTFSNAFTVLKNGHVGIGLSNPTEVLDIHGNDAFGGDADLDMTSYGSNITSFHIRSAAGTRLSPVAVNAKSNANFYNMEAQGYDGGSYRNAAAIRMGAMATSLTGAGDMPGRIDFHTSSDGTVNDALRMRLDDNGNLGIGTGSSTITAKLQVNGTIKATAINFTGLPVFANDAAATTLVAGDMYRTSTGELRIKL